MQPQSKVKKEGKFIQVKNLFEKQPNKKSRKNDVLGRPKRGMNRDVSTAREKAYEERKKTILVEYNSRGLSNQMIDKRVAQMNNSMSKEDKALMRLKRARSRKGIYNLDDNDDGFDGNNAKKQKYSLTHYGQTLGDVMDYKAIMSNRDGDDEDEDYLRRLLAQSSSSKVKDDYGDEDEEDDDGYGRKREYDATELVRILQEQKKLGISNNDESGRKKSRKEIMEEVIKKSKLFKAARQKAKDEDEDEREMLDSMITDLLREDKSVQLISSKKNKEQSDLENLLMKHANLLGDDNDVKDKVNQINNKRANNGFGDQEEDEEKGAVEEDDYERALKELRFEARAAAATNRTKTPEEIAKEQREELERLEEERNKRMMGEVDDDNNDELEGDDDLDDDEKDRKKKKKGILKPSRDALLAHFEGDDTSLPYILDCPESHIEILELLKRYPDARLDDALFRIRKSSSILLSPDNKQKMINLTEALINHLVYLTECITSNVQSFDKADCDIVVQHLYDLSHEIPNPTADMFAVRLFHIQRGLEIQLQNVKNVYHIDGSNGGDIGSESPASGRDITIPIGKSLHKKKGWIKGEKGKRRLEEEHEEEDRAAELRGDSELYHSEFRCWPSPGDVAFLKAISMIFPVTDFRHPVVSPAQLLLGQYLSSCPVRGPRDILSSVVTAQLLSDFTSSGKRFSPELIVFFCGFLSQLSLVNEKKENANNDTVRTYPHLFSLGSDAKVGEFDFLRKHLLESDASINKKKKKKDEKSLSATSPISLALLALSNDEDLDENAVAHSILSSIFDLLDKLIDILKDIKSFDVLFSGILASLKKLPSSHAYAEICTKIVKKIDDGIKACIRNREPMQLQTFRTKAITFYTPKLEKEKRTSDSYHREDNDPRAKADEIRALKKQVKKERKGVARSLRLDALFINAQRSKEKEMMAQRIQQKMKQDRSFIETSHAEYRKIEKEGGIKTRR